MKQITLAIALIILLASCGTSESGKRESQYTIARVKLLDESTVSWIRLNTIEARIYKMGDTLTMKTNTHIVAQLGDDFNTTLVQLDSILSKQ